MDITTNAPKGASFHFQDDEANKKSFFLKKILFSIFHFLEKKGGVCGICLSRAHSDTFGVRVVFLLGGEGQGRKFVRIPTTHVRIRRRQ